MAEVHLQEVEGHRDQVEADMLLAFDRNQGIDVAVGLPDVGLPDVDLPGAVVYNLNLVHILQKNKLWVRYIFFQWKCE